ncbi:MAG: hypothetical protein NWF00_06395 [Candidatus Bathyarchaeota archaeon]|nr:hypothetical protein [Candidatus Bathyarchaeota archaeon]
MHDYSIDSNERLQIPLYLAIVSILFMGSVQATLNFYHLVLPWWIDGVSVFGFYGFLLLLFDKYLWKWRFLRTLNVVHTPNLNGTYEGNLLSSYSEFKKEIPISVEVVQNWTKISIVWKTKTSCSRSLVASMLTQTEPNILTYQYLNEPNQNAPEALHMHRGTATTDIEKDQTLSGGCYNNRDGKTTVTFNLKKVN